MIRRHSTRVMYTVLTSSGAILCLACSSGLGEPPRAAGGGAAERELTENQRAFLSRDDKEFQALLNRYDAALWANERDTETILLKAELLAGFGHARTAAEALSRFGQFNPQKGWQDYHRIVASLLTRRGEILQASQEIEKGLAAPAGDEGARRKLMRFRAVLPFLRYSHRIAQQVYDQRFFMPPARQKQLLLESLAYHPANPLALSMLAYVDGELGKLDEAVDLMSFALASDRDCPVVWIRRNLVAAMMPQSDPDNKPDWLASQVLLSSRGLDEDLRSEVLLMNARLQSVDEKGGYAAIKPWLVAAAKPFSSRQVGAGAATIRNPWALRQWLITAYEDADAAGECLAVLSKEKALSYDQDLWPEVRLAAAKAYIVAGNRAEAKAQLEAALRAPDSTCKEEAAKLLSYLRSLNSRP
jgi:hypothetical protein